MFDNDDYNFNFTPEDKVAINLCTALLTAIRAHVGQKDLAGVQFYHHVLRVGMAMSPDPEGMMIGFLHDAIEDTPLTTRDILEAFGPNVAGPVTLLTRQDDETYWDYISRLIRDSGHFPKALEVKRFDLLDNLAPWRQTFEGFEGIKARHEMALRFVEHALIERGLLNESERYTPVHGAPGRSLTPRPVERGDAALADNRVSGAGSPSDIHYIFVEFDEGDIPGNS